MKSIWGKNKKLWSKLWTKSKKNKIHGEMFSVHRLADLILSTCQFFPTWSIDSMQSQSKSQHYFVDINTLIPKFVWIRKRCRIANTVLKNEVGGLTLPNLQICCKATVIKTMWDWWKNRHIDQWKEERTQKYTHINIVNWSLTKEQGEYNGQKIVFSANGAGTTGNPHVKQEMNLGIDVIPFTKINSKWIIDLNIKH